MKTKLRNIRYILTSKINDHLDVIVAINFLVLIYMVLSNNKDGSVIKILTLFCAMTLALMFRDKIKKVSFAGISAELDKQVEKSKSLYWVNQGEVALTGKNYDLALYCYHTAIEKDQNINLAQIGIAATLRYKVYNNYLNSSIVDTLQEAINCCQKAEKIELSWVESGGTEDKGPIYMQLSLIILACYMLELENGKINILRKSIENNAEKAIESICLANRNRLEEIMLEYLSDSINSFKKTCIRDKVQKGEKYEIYSGEELLKASIYSDSMFVDFITNNRETVFVNKLINIVGERQ